MRELRRPTGIDTQDKSLLMKHLGAAEPAETVAARLTAELNRSQNEHDLVLKKRDAHSASIDQQHARVKRLQVGLLEAKRVALRAEQAQRKQKAALRELAATDASAAEAWSRMVGEATFRTIEPPATLTNETTCDSPAQKVKMWPSHHYLPPSPCQPE